MNPDLKQTFAHVIWIGGGTDTGKTCIARMLAEKHGLQVYHYDRHDSEQIERLAQTHPRYQVFLDASLEERWIVPEPEDLTEFALQSFQDRFPLVIEELLDLPKAPGIVVEGFGFTPELLIPFLLSPRQAVWLTPSEEFKLASMKRRNKPSFKDQVSDPDRAFKNVFERDMLLAGHIRVQAESCGLTVFQVDGTRSLEEMAELVEVHFDQFLS